MCKKIALVSMIDDKFFIMYEAWIKSLLWSNGWFDYLVILIDVGLSKKNKEKCLDYYNNIDFRKPKFNNYTKVFFGKTHPKLKKTFYKLDTFSFYDVDRIVFIDIDTLILKDIRPLFDCEYPIAGMRGYSSGIDKMRSDINSGVFVVNKRFISDKVYSSLLEIAGQGFSMPDQRVINKYFKSYFTFLDKKYNCEKRMLFSKQFKDKLLDECIILHFVSQKPHEKKKDMYNKGFESLENVWKLFYDNSLDNLNKNLEKDLTLKQLIGKVNK